MLPLSVENVLLTLKEFLTVWINQIIYYNNIYVQESFSKFKSFDLVVYKSRNPIFNQYVDELINNFFQLLLKKKDMGKVHQISLIIYDTNSMKSSQKYSFKLQDFIEVEDIMPNLDFLHKESSRETLIEMPNITWQEIYNQFKTVTYEHINCLKERSKVIDANNELFYKIIIELDDSINLNNEDTGANWVRINETSDNPSKQLSRITDRENKIKFKSIGEVDLSVMSFDLYNEYV